MLDLAEFRLLLQGVLDEALHRGAPIEPVLHVADLARQVVAELAERRDTRRPNTRRLVERVRRLEHDLRDRDPALRREIICRRLGIGRSRYFELRKLALSPPAGPDCGGVQSVAVPHGAARTNSR